MLIGYLASLARCLLKGYKLIGTLYKVASTTVLARCTLTSLTSKNNITCKDACDFANKYDNNTEKL